MSSTHAQELIEHELIQARLLSAIFSRSVRNQVVLKGGMAFRALFGSQRATKDIDLAQDASRSLASLQRLMRQSIQASAQGFLQDIQVTEPKQTQTTARWKIHGRTAQGTEIALTVEVSRRGIPEDHIEARHYLPPEDAHTSAVEIDVYSPGALAASKVFALAADNRVAPRDLYDLDLLVRMKVSPPADLLAALGDPEQVVRRIWDKLDLMTWEQFQSEVSPFLPPSVGERLTEGDFDAMRLRVGEAVQSWLRQDPND